MVCSDLNLLLCQLFVLHNFISIMDLMREQISHRIHILFNLGIAIESKH